MPPFWAVAHWRGAAPRRTAPSRCRYAGPMRIGLVSDTHDLLRPAVLDFLRGSDHIVHAGDICGPAVLDALRAIAPLTVVRGNNDRGAWADPLNETEIVTLGEVRLLVIHDLQDLQDLVP